MKSNTDLITVIDWSAITGNDIFTLFLLIAVVGLIFVVIGLLDQRAADRAQLQMFKDAATPYTLYKVAEAMKRRQAERSEARQP
jgi:hypothetical protein